MGKIILDKIKIFGFHGSYPEEKIVGSNFSIKLEIELDFLNASIHDELSQTVDYTSLYKIVKEEMKIKSNLMENLAIRIIKRIKKIEKVIHTKILLCKENPPLEGIVDNVCIMIEE
ncbi:dihydroneopterin aldolase [Blattabacterium cuenoti]|uniref:dihydroneopterin aldolase n=1 Tax=Blattabacterium cuenoti TaxID=1653831 RepID=UPI00163CF1F3|nr:dihydroneopterin aldolase [Blattabacterium cuenoti]